MNVIKKSLIVGVGVLVVPFVAAATTIQELISPGGAIYDTLNALFPLIVLLIFLAFAWGIFKFVTAAGDEEARKTGRAFMLWAIIGFFVLIAVWGLVNLLSDSLGLDNDTTPTLPGVPQSQGNF